ncbi:hypothetical protein WJX72_001406 [[Myrmecia] bisecta]|uniref:Peroxisomal membrane protein PEX16 n=1 Tax=[Myrmecia] bisecta TaxID=41462 RepID=A0AAW1PSF7_9CHLO
MGALLERYKEFVRSNANLLSALEGALSSLTYLLPDRFAESELTLEALNSFLGLIGMYHESILSTPSAASGLPAPIPWPLWLGALQQVEVLVEMGAIAAERTGRLNKYGPLAALEAAKAILRLVILYRAGGRILTDGGLTMAEAASSGKGTSRLSPEMRARAVYGAFARFRQQYALPHVPQYTRTASAKLLRIDTSPDLQGSSSSQPASPGPSHDLPCAAPAASPGSPPVREPRGKHADMEASSSGRSGAYWWDQPLQASPSSMHLNVNASEDPCSSTGCSSPCSEARRQHLKRMEMYTQRRQALGMNLLVVGELLHILRPLLYVMALRRSGRTSWKPWLLSLGLDLASSKLITAGASIAQQAAEEAVNDPSLQFGSIAVLYNLQAFRWTPAEQRERLRRRLLLMYYLLRSPFFERYTRRGVSTVQRIAHPIPLLGTLASKAVEILFGIQQYYTYTGAS